MVTFLLNDELVETDAPAGTVILDVVRHDRQLSGTKIGCREGDCGACTVLVGELRDGRLEYRSMTSCLLALASVHGKHVVTVEGLGLPGLSPVQRAMVEASGTQCGFCTPGFVVSLTALALSSEPASAASAVRAIDGNICRCTGYKSIERAARDVAGQLADKDARDPLAWSVAHGFLPAWFGSVAERLRAIPAPAPARVSSPAHPAHVGGGTDLYVQRHDTMTHAPVAPLIEDLSLRGIREEAGHGVIGGAAVVTDLLESPLLHRHFPRLTSHLLLVSSTPIRNMGTVAGNFVNASPIGDLTAFFLALGSTLSLRSSEGTLREVALDRFFEGYKQIDKRPDEVIVSVRFPLPGPATHFGFEKVSKRTMLDIASVNSAARIETEGDRIQTARLSAGGVAPVPLFLREASASLTGKPLTAGAVRAACEVAQSEISPISDARGSADYKRLLLRQLLFAHFLTLFPERVALEELG